MTDTSLLQTQLESLGLTGNDAQVYLFLLERGGAFGNSKIATRLSLHRQYVHASLQKLLARGLIEEVPTGARRQYKALPPQYLTHMAKQQLEGAERLARELSIISSVGAEQDFEVYRGTRQVFAFEESVVHGLKDDEVQYIIGGGAETFISFFGDQYESISAVAKTRRLRTHYVGCPGEGAWLDRASSAVGLFEYRILDALPKTIVQTVIRFDTVTLYTFANPPLVYVIKSAAVAADYKKFFDMLWGMAK